jgi:hypothetical protein
VADNENAYFTICTVPARIAHMEFVGKTIAFAGKLIVFVALSVLVVPSFLVMTYLQKTWADMLSDLFNL